MRPLGAVLAACALFAAPAALSAQPVNQQPLPPNTRTIPPVRRPHPMPTSHHRYGNRNGTSYPVVIDGSIVDRYLVTPAPAPKRTPAAHHAGNGQDVFETHSSDDAK